MNRRTFLTGVIASTATTLAFTSLASALDEPTWDPASQLYGNMFGALGKAEEGKVQFVSRTAHLDTGDSPEIFGVLHNNTDTTQTMLGLADRDVLVDFSQIDPMQSYIAPGGYGLVKLSYLPEDFSQETLDGLTPATSSQEEAEQLPYADLLASIPLTVKSVSFGADTLQIEIENTSDQDLEDFSVGGLVMWFDEPGAPTDGLSFIVEGEVKASSSRTITQTFYKEDGIATDRFLIGLKGYAGQVN